MDDGGNGKESVSATMINRTLQSRTFAYVVCKYEELREQSTTSVVFEKLQVWRVQWIFFKVNKR